MVKIVASPVVGVKTIRNVITCMEPASMGVTEGLMGCYVEKVI